jgi:hypothetical protein
MSESVLRPPSSDLRLSERDCRLRAGVLAMEPELPEEIALRIQHQILRIVQAWMRDPASEAAHEHVLSAYLAFCRALKARDGLRARSGAAGAGA